LEHAPKSGVNTRTARVAAADEELLARRRAILAEQRRVQARHRRELQRLSADYLAVMRELRWPSGCVALPEVTL
jgi:hypothetical protein